ncbi:hypothetical protein ACFR9U_09885 [Halorientalis brevis]|uniref:Uncharacterized protein n=1 Tax=Halorientalis brevis TaxID=1126241 RepID=A0ABD6CAM3_9EURY|nr:hypothetical protein [Halorientalis brevis]
MRAQVHTLEAIVGALLLLTSVVFALQMTAVTPLSASTSSQHIENQQQASVEGVLASAAESGALRRAVLYWNETGERFQNTSSETFYTIKAPPNEFGRTLERQFGDRGVAYNVRVYYRTASGNVGEQLMVNQGEPSDNAVMSARTVVLTDDARLYNESGERPGTSVEDSYMSNDVAKNSPVHTVVRVEVIVWRI